MVDGYAILNTSKGVAMEENEISPEAIKAYIPEEPEAQDGKN